MTVTLLPENETKVIDSASTNDDKKINTYGAKVIDYKIENRQLKVLISTIKPAISLGAEGNFCNGYHYMQIN